MILSNSERGLAPTFDTPVGTVIRLTKGEGLLAKTGSLAVVSGAAPMYLKVNWIRDKRSGVQQDGNYRPANFEVFAFQVGDRVVTTDGRYGTIEEFLTNKKARLRGAWTGNTLLVRIADLSLHETSTRAVPLRVGDVVVVDTEGRQPSWDGLRAEVAIPERDGSLYLNPKFGPRPDGHGLRKFNWPAAEVRAFDPDRDFRVGDTVHVENRGKRPFTFDGYYTDDIITMKNSDGGVSWDFASRLRLQPAPVVPRVPQPRKENWVFEPGQQIAHRDVLNDLPMGTVVIGFSYWGSPYVKLGRNRWGRMLDVIRAVEATDSLRGAADRGDAIIVYVPPTES